MDLNDDGQKDILIGSFSGIPQWIEGTKDGYGKSTDVLDGDGAPVIISEFWDVEEDDWNESDKTGTTGHCSSVAAVDWDDDGDMDLLLGGYRNGGLFLRLNEGSSTQTKFATKNETIKVGDKPISFDGGMGAPRVGDWDGDGLFDIVVGTIRGEVVLFRNAGSKGKPAFPEMTTLVKALPGPSGSKQIKRVAAAKDGEGPVGPGSSYHIELVDYDADGDLDLLVGGRSEWLTGPEKVPTEEELELAAKLKEESSAAYSEFAKRKKEAAKKGEDEGDKYRASDEAKALLKTYRDKRVEAIKITADPKETGDFVWLYRRN